MSDQALTDLQAQLDEHRAAITAIATEVRRLQDQVRSSPPPAEQPTWSWAELTGEARRTAWQELAGWVEWLIATYRPEGWWSAEWYRHPGIVEELKGLRGFHLTVAGLPALGSEYVEWHEALSQFLHRRAEGGPPRRQPSPAPDQGADFARFVEEDVAAHSA